MHPYATDSVERTRVPLFLAAAAIISAWTLPKLIDALGLSVPWWVDAPSVMALYGTYVTLFDRFLWRWSLLQRIGLVAVPDIAGEWQFHVHSSHDDVRKKASVTIHQTWRSIQIRLKTDQSRSSSQIAALLTEDPNEYVLSYEFLNTPNSDAVGTMHMHRGSVEIRLPKNGAIRQGEGEYYSGRDRANQGRLSVERL